MTPKWPKFTGGGRRRPILVALAAAVLGGCGGHSPRHPPAPRIPPQAPTTTASPPPATQQFGASVNRLFNTPTYSDAQIDAQLAALAQTGVTIARSDALWEAAEPTAPAGGVHHYDWTFADRIAGALARHRLRWLAIIDYSAPWAQSVPGQDHSAPASAAAYASYAAAFAKRYGDGGSFWAAHPELTPEPVQTIEIWNEPDNPAFWAPAPSAGAYAGLYAAARASIAAVQPGARVIVGGLTHPASFLPAMLAADPSLRGTIEGVGIHPYGRTPGRVLDSVRRARATLDGLGMRTTPLYVTELGWTTSPPRALDYVPRALRPRYIQASLAGLGRIGCGVEATVLYTWVTPERDPADPQDWFGIHPPSGGTSPDTEAFTAGVGAAAESPPAPGACG